jgi:hypothetical protein
MVNKKRMKMNVCEFSSSYGPPLFSSQCLVGTFMIMLYMACPLLMPYASIIQKDLPQDLKSDLASTVNMGDASSWRLGLTPDWFKDIDTGFEVVSIIVTFLIAFASYKFYKLTGEKKYKWFSLSFISIALAYIFKILTNIIVYNETWIGREILGRNTLTYQYIHEYYYFEIFGTIAFRLFMLLGLFGLYYIICKSKDRKTIPIVIFLLLMTTIFSTVQYFAFHLTAALMLGMIMYQYWQNWKEKKKKVYKTSYAFGLLFLSQIIFSVLFLTPDVYVVAEILQLLGFLTLLWMYIKLVWAN